MNRVLLAARLQWIGWPLWMAWLWGILALSFTVNLGVFAVAQSQMNGNETTGGLLSLYIMVLVGSVTMMTQTFPLAIGLSLSRRAFYLGSWLLTVAQSAVYAAVLLLLRLVEDATDGWGVSMRFFGIPFLRQDNLAVQYLIYFVPFLFAAAIGTIVGGVAKRWGTPGILTIMALAIVVPGLLVILVSWRRWWSAVGEWLTDQSGVTLAVGLPALVAVALFGAGYGVIRRATA